MLTMCIEGPKDRAYEIRVISEIVTTMSGNKRNSPYTMNVATIDDRVFYEFFHVTKQDISLAVEKLFASSGDFGFSAAVKEDDKE